MRYQVSLIAIIAVLFVVSCSKEDEINNAPVISIESMRPSSVSELDEGITIVLSYRDEDGDLGENDASVKNLFVHDSRNDVVHEYRIKQLAPTGVSITIQGTLSIDVDPLVLVSNGSSEEGVFMIYCVDRAGNKSNLVFTPKFTVTE